MSVTISGGGGGGGGSGMELNGVYAGSLELSGLGSTTIIGSSSPTENPAEVAVLSEGNGIRIKYSDITFNDGTVQSTAFTGGGGGALTAGQVFAQSISSTLSQDPYATGPENEVNWYGITSQWTTCFSIISDARYSSYRFNNGYVKVKLVNLGTGQEGLFDFTYISDKYQLVSATSILGDLSGSQGSSNGEAAYLVDTDYLPPAGWGETDVAPRPFAIIFPPV
jgi:hypothetical protein